MTVERPRYEAWGYLLASELPTSLDIDEFARVRCEPDHDRQEVLARTVPSDLRADIRQGVDYWESSPASVRLHSNYFLFARGDGDDEDDALERLDRTYAQPLLAALMARTGQPAYVQWLRIGEVSPNGRIDAPQSPYSDWAKMRRVSIADLAPDHSASLGQLTRTIRRDQISIDCSVDLRQALAMEAVDGGRDEAIDAAMLRYFRPVERIAKNLHKGRSVKQGEEYARIVDQLTEDLKKNGSVKTKVSRIRNATSDLAKADGHRLEQQVEHAAQKMGLPDDLRMLAKRFVKVRNTALGHATSKGRQGFTCGQARAVSLGFYSAFVRSRDLD